MLRSAILEPDFHLEIKQGLFIIATFIAVIIYAVDVHLFLQDERREIGAC